MGAQLLLGGFTHPGRRRHNADAWAATCRRAVLADGAGMAGAWVAREAVQAVIHAPLGDPAGAIRSADTAVHELTAGCGAATIVMVELTTEPAAQGRRAVDHVAVVAHVGDSRCLLATDVGARWLTEMHNVAAELAREGVIPSGTVASHPLRHRLTRFLGSAHAAADIVEVRVRHGDRLLLLTDGVHDSLGLDEISKLVHSGDVAAVAESLVITAFERGATDNVTAVVVEVADVPVGLADRDGR